jgi:hypothetical protein
VQRRFAGWCGEVVDGGSEVVAERRVGEKKFNSLGDVTFQRNAALRTVPLQPNLEAVPDA